MPKVKYTIYYYDTSNIHIIRRLIIIAFVTIDASTSLPDTPDLQFFFTGRQNHLSFLQKILYVPGSDGIYPQNYQDTWIIRLAVIGRSRVPI